MTTVLITPVIGDCCFSAVAGSAGHAPSCGVGSGAGSSGSQALAACSAPAALRTVLVMGENDRQRRAREASYRYFTEAIARMFDPDRKNRTAARIVDLWDARRARGAARRPTLSGHLRATLAAVPLLPPPKHRPRRI